ncbi:MAG: MFS transporter [Synergistaceae bacterium]|jgi:DHA3 family macrolide efflux protein-like MFS transporter|nr:MFS transporter [Synergistaceae bacterium]
MRRTPSSGRCGEPPDTGWKKGAVLFLASQNISLFGSEVVGFTILWHVTLATSSGKWMMWTILCLMLPQVAISLHAGVWADRYDRKRIIVLSDAFIAAVTLVLFGAFFAGCGSLELLLAAGTLRSLGGGIQAPAVSAFLPQIVPKEQLTKINGINQALRSLFSFLAPAFGGILLGFAGITWAFLLDVVTAAAAIAILLSIEADRLPPREARSVFGFLRELREGIVFTLSHPVLKYLVLCYGVSFFLISPAAFLTPVMIERTFGNEVWRLTANELVWAAGSFGGGFFVASRGKFADKVRTISYSLIAFGVLFGLLGMSRTFIFYLSVMGCAGFFVPILMTAETVLIQEKVENAMMGRVFSIIQLISGGAMPLGMIVFGPLADWTSIESILTVTGILLALVGMMYGRLAKEQTAPPA